ncbi:MAG TPA: hypothetical protein VGR37_17260, partial [Longimicrobiaceae bacterium]|nr:hypothetical protein [Longimicrobiaceae bacterium]
AGAAPRRPFGSPFSRSFHRTRIARVVVLLSLLLFLAAAAGLLALLGRLLAALLRAGLAAAEKTHNDNLLEASLQRGDLTALAERRAEAKSLRHARARAGGLALLWAALVVVPPLVGAGQEVYALSSLLWLLPGRPVLPRRPASRP